MSINVKTIETVSLTINGIELILTFDEVKELQKQLKLIVNNKFGEIKDPFKEKEINIYNDFLDKFKYEKNEPFNPNNVPKFEDFWKFSYPNYTLELKIPKDVPDNENIELKTSNLFGDTMYNLPIHIRSQIHQDLYDKVKIDMGNLMDKQVTKFGLVDDKSWESLQKNIGYS